MAALTASSVLITDNAKLPQVRKIPVFCQKTGI
jgi:hypothetical protein